MKEYYAKFRGRKAGSIGVTYQIATMVKGKDKKTARLNLYKEYEHITCLTLEKV